MTAPDASTRDTQKNIIVYRDEHYTLGLEHGHAYLITDGKCLTLSCHPFEPCLYITEENGCRTVVHNAFDPFVVLELFSAGKTMTSITGRGYDAQSFCKMVAYAAGKGELQIDDAEKVFLEEGKADKGVEEPAEIAAERFSENPSKKTEERSAEETIEESAEKLVVIPAPEILSDYSDLAAEYCIVGNNQRAAGLEAHRNALESACRELFFDGLETIWDYDVSAAEGQQIDTAALFAASGEPRAVNYRGAFCFPPSGVRYSDEDFDRVNKALFPNGTDELEVYQWSTDWSSFFDDGHEWWGALCISVYDRSLDRFTIIMASETD